MSVYTGDDALRASEEYFKGDDFAAGNFVSKYALRNKEGKYVESTPLDMHVRLAKEFARIEKKYPESMSEKDILELLTSWRVVPQGSPMSGIGNDVQLQSLSNCFVIESPYDSYGGILKTDQEQAQIMKRRGGVGFDISTIRPRGLITANAARTTDGIGVFMERFSNTCREVAQGGRRGALMLTVSVHHPEIRTFINIKKDKKKVTGANISIRLTDEFMQAVKEDKNVQLRFPVEKDVQHLVEESVSASELWDEIIHAAWESAEPGLLFWDTIRREGPADAYPEFSSTSTNPCGEITLSPYDSCRLMLVNLVPFVRNEFTDKAWFDADHFWHTVYKAQRLMDDLVDLELEVIDKVIKKIIDDPEPDDVKRIELDLWQKIKNAATRGRRTGLGITGLGDALAYLNIKYGSDESVKMTDEIYSDLADAAYTSSVHMAEQRGAFPAFSRELEKGHPFLDRVLGDINVSELAQKHDLHGRRNIALTTTAPAGTVSTLTMTSSGCEPAFLISYKRKKKINANDSVAKVDFVDAMGDKWTEHDIYHHGFKRWQEVTGLSDPKLSPYWEATSADIDWVKKIDVQAAAQRWICHSISNTTNIPNETSVDVVKQIYMKGWETGCKGVTIYRAGSRDGVLTALDEPKKASPGQQPAQITDTHAPKRPRELVCDIHRSTIQGNTYIVIVGLLDGRPYEVFAGRQEHVEVPKKIRSGILIKNGRNKDGVATYNLKIVLDENDDDCLLFKDIVNLFDDPIHGALTRTISLALRHGVPVQYVVEQLRKDKHSDIVSFSKCIARVLSKSYIADGTVSTMEKSCPDCNGQNLSYQQGCVTCLDCGGSRCG